MPLKPQDLLLVLKLSAVQISLAENETSVAKVRKNANKRSKKELNEKTGILTNWTFRSLAKSLGLSLSQVNASIERALLSKLLVKIAADQKPKPILPSVTEFLIHGAMYSFPAETGSVVRGIPTAFAFKAIKDQIVTINEPPPVWAYSGGNQRGYSVSPLYKTAPMAALQDDTLYALLALFDTIRIGRARERTIAKEKIQVLMA